MVARDAGGTIPALKAPRGRDHSGPVVVEDAPYRMQTPANGSPGAVPGTDAPAPAYVRPSYFLAG